MIYNGINIPKPQLAELCQRHHIRKLSLFGSILRDDFDNESDIDILVEFEQGHTPGFAFFGIQQELTGLLGRQVDLHTPGFLSEYIRDQIIREAEPQYVAA